MSKHPGLCVVCSSKAFSKCSRCLTAGLSGAMYCGTACQRADYKSHKLTCGFVPSTAQKLRYAAFLSEMSELPKRDVEDKAKGMTSQLFVDWGGGDESKGKTRILIYMAKAGTEDSQAIAMDVIRQAISEAGLGVVLLSQLIFDDDGELKSTRAQAKAFFREKLLATMPKGFDEDLYTMVVMHYSALLVVSRTAVHRAMLLAGLPMVDGEPDKDSPNLFRGPPKPGLTTGFLVDKLREVEVEARKFGNGDVEKGVAYVAGILFELHDFACFSAAMKDGLVPDQSNRLAVTWKPSENFLNCMAEKNAEFGIEDDDD